MGNLRRTLYTPGSVPDRQLLRRHLANSQLNSRSVNLTEIPPRGPSLYTRTRPAPLTNSMRTLVLGNPHKKGTRARPWTTARLPARTPLLPSAYSQNSHACFYRVLSRSLFRSVCRWLLVTSHVLWALEGAPVLVAESEELSEVDMVVRVVHLLADGRDGARGWRVEQEGSRGWTASVRQINLQSANPHSSYIIAFVEGLLPFSPFPHRVVLGAHDRLRVTRHSVVDVRRPDSREPEHDHMCVVVARDEEQAYHVRASLCSFAAAPRSTEKQERGSVFMERSSSARHKDRRRFELRKGCAQVQQCATQGSTSIRTKEEMRTRSRHTQHVTVCGTERKRGGQTGHRPETLHSSHENVVSMQSRSA